MRIVIERDSNPAPKIKFRLSKFQDRYEAEMFNDLMYLEGAISKREYKQNKRKIWRTKYVFRLVRW